jgi:hypothetical protein
MRLGAGASGGGLAVDESPQERGTGPDDWARPPRGCLVLGGLFLLGAAILVVLGVLAANSLVLSSYNVVGTYLSLFIAAALAIGGIALIALAVFGWGPRDGGAR